MTNFEAEHRVASAGFSLFAAMLLCLTLVGLTFPGLARAEGVALTRQWVQVSSADGRISDVELTYPASRGDKLGVVLFSHGAFATPQRYADLLGHWAQQGFVIVAPRHIDSEEHPQREQYKPTDHLPTRIADMSALAQADLAALAPALKGRLIEGRIAATGHSFGALIAQAMAGATPLAAAGEDVPVPIQARQHNVVVVVALSPPPTFANFLNPAAWESVRVPALTQTGTSDVSPGFADFWHQHRAAHDFAAPGNKTLLVYTDVDHYMNGTLGRPVEGAIDGPQGAPYRNFRQLSAMYLREHLKQERTARRWLRQSLEEAGKLGWSEQR